MGGRLGAQLCVIEFLRGDHPVVAQPTGTREVSGGQPVGGGRFPVKYYLTAMLFIVFDIEIVFLYPWAVSFDRLGTFALVEMMIFVGTVFVAYAYVWRRGGLEWD